MRRKDESKKPIISDFINAFYYEHDKVPSVREIVEGTGIPLSTVHRYLRDMQEKGEVSYNGYRSARTKEMSEVSPIHGIAVLDTVACGPGQEEEQQALKTDAETLRQEIEVQEQQNQNLELFIQKVHQYADLDELTAYAAHDLIKAIYIGAPDKSSGKRRQSISICYDFVGFIPLDELMKQETA